MSVVRDPAAPTSVEGPAAASPARPATIQGRRGARALPAAVVVVVAAGVALRIWCTSPLWLDEALSVAIARLPLRALPAALRHDGAPPLYYVLLHVWMRLFGTGDVAVRSLSGACSIATLPVIWLAGQRAGGRRTAVAALVLLASSPFAVRYGTETRMYALVSLLVALGYLAVSALLRAPSLPRAAVVAACAAALLYTHYWSLYLLAVVGVVMLLRAVRGEQGARHVVGALAVAGVAFVPWLPTFLFQAAHTGAPWGSPPRAASLNDTLGAFAGGGRDPAALLFLLLAALLVLGLFGRPVDHHRIELDLRLRPHARPITAVAVATLAVAILAGVATRAAFASRYASIVFPLFIVLFALGVRCFDSRRARAVVLAAAAVLGLAGGVSADTGRRTTADRAAAALAAYAQPGDVVGYCPDQLGPAVARLAHGPATTSISYADALGPSRVDWVDYRERVHGVRPVAFADRLLAAAGPSHAVFLVWSPGYRVWGLRCEQLRAALASIRPTTIVVKLGRHSPEHPGVVRFAGS